MNLNCGPRRVGKCLYYDCESFNSSVSVVRKGYYRRKSDSQVVARYTCKSCRRSFSSAIYSACYRQKRRRLNEPIRKLLVSGVSQRRTAILLGTNRKTVVRKFLFLAKQARRSHKIFLKQMKFNRGPLSSIQFDEMESSEKSKCLPVSIPIVIDPVHRKILGIKVCSMPAKGLLADISRKKYGKRADHRPFTAVSLLKELKPLFSKKIHIVSDENPKYPNWLQSVFEDFKHEKFKGRRGCVVGQGELKRGGFDPLFALNHTCAMIRANINRLFRRTWCTTKRRDRLQAHLDLYVDYHNRVLTT